MGAAGSCSDAPEVVEEVQQFLEGCESKGHIHVRRASDEEMAEAEEKRLERIESKRAERAERKGSQRSSVAEPVQRSQLHPARSHWDMLRDELRNVNVSGRVCTRVGPK